MSRKKISVSAPWDTELIVKFREYAQQKGFGLELTSFVKPSSYYIRNNDALKSLLETHLKEFFGFKNRLSMHGPIMDIIPHTVDEEIKALVSRRVIKTMKVAEHLRIKKVIFHTGINPVITAPNYYNKICKLQAEFWDEILGRFKNQIICLENMWEPDTKILRNILRNSKSDRLKICLDVAHANVYGKIPLTEWFKKLSDHIVHLHVNDNNGGYDQHLAFGEGNIDWKTIMSEIDKLKTEPQVVIEIPEMTKLKKSLKYLKFNGYME